MAGVRNLIIITHRQLNKDNPALAEIDPARDLIVMAEAGAEWRRHNYHLAAIAVACSAMRHYAESLRERGFKVEYSRLEQVPNNSLAEIWVHAIVKHKPALIVATEFDTWQREADLEKICQKLKVRLEWRVDSHFLITRAKFEQMVGAKPTILLDNFYETMRKAAGIMTSGVTTTEERLAAEAREASRRGPASIGREVAPPLMSFQPDPVTRAVISEVSQAFPENPGSLAKFGWAVTREDALKAMEFFMKWDLPDFSDSTEERWDDRWLMSHAQLESALNLQLLHPREVVEAAIAEYRAARTPYSVMSAYVKHVAGWREFMRGAYWREMPGLATANFFKAKRPLPAWFWNGRTQMQCLSQTIKQALSKDYLHPRQRQLMTGNFALIAGISPAETYSWHAAMNVDAVEYVERTAVASVTLFADGGRCSWRPRVLKGAHLRRMSKLCAGCFYQPEAVAGPKACPITVMYYHFLAKNDAWLRGNPPTNYTARNLDRLSQAERASINQLGPEMLEKIDKI